MITIDVPAIITNANTNSAVMLFLISITMTTFCSVQKSQNEQQREKGEKRNSLCACLQATASFTAHYQYDTVPSYSANHINKVTTDVWMSSFTTYYCKRVRIKEI